MDPKTYDRYLAGMKKLHQNHPDWADYPGGFYIPDYLRDSDSPHAKCLINFAPSTYVILSKTKKIGVVDMKKVDDTRNRLKANSVNYVDYPDDAFNFVIKIVAEIMGKTCELATSELPDLLILSDSSSALTSIHIPASATSKVHDSVMEDNTAISNMQTLLGNLNVTSKDIYNATPQNPCTINHPIQIKAEVDNNTGIATIVAYQYDPNVNLEYIDYCNWTITKSSSSPFKFLKTNTNHRKTSPETSMSPNKLIYPLTKYGEYTISVEIIYKSPLESIKLLSCADVTCNYLKISK